MQQNLAMAGITTSQNNAAESMANQNAFTVGQAEVSDTKKIESDYLSSLQAANAAITHNGSSHLHNQSGSSQNSQNLQNLQNSVAQNNQNLNLSHQNTQISQLDQLQNQLNNQLTHPSGSGINGLSYTENLLQNYAHENNLTTLNDMNSTTLQSLQNGLDGINGLNANLASNDNFLTSLNNNSNTLNLSNLNGTEDLSSNTARDHLFR